MRDWCINEMGETKKVLAELAESTQGFELPTPEEVVMPGRNDWRYGFHFTDKDPEDIKHLSNYELQHAIYYAHKMVDSDNEEKVEHGKKLLTQIFDELDTRGIVGLRPACITDEKDVWAN